MEESDEQQKLLSIQVDKSLGDGCSSTDNQLLLGLFLWKTVHGCAGVVCPLQHGAVMLQMLWPSEASAESQIPRRG